MNRTDQLEREVRALRRDRIALVVVAALLGAFLLISNVAYRKRKQQRAILDDRTEDYVSDRSKRPRFVDVGILLCVVVPDQEHGEELIPGLPRMKVIEKTEHGGIVDLKAVKTDGDGNPVFDKKGRPVLQPRIVLPSPDPIVWFCSADQYPIVVHGDDDPMGIMAYGSEGAGKTELLPRWHYMRWLENLGEGREGGQTAPTKRRLKMFEDAFFRVFPRAWVKKYRRSAGVITLIDGTRIQLMQTHQQSKAGGSPIQGYNWSWCGSDEFQDSYEKSDDIDARGRSAKFGLYKQLRTCTAKDTTAWREFKSKLVETRDIKTNRPLWAVKKILGRNSPFVAKAHWDALKAKLSPREYARRVEPLDDQAPDLAVYYGFRRDRNIVNRPDIATDVTAAVLAGYQSYLHPRETFGLLVDHDPGNIYNTSLVKRLLMFGGIPTWVVVGEIQTRQTTQRQHAALLAEYLRDVFAVRTVSAGGGPKLNGPVPIVFPDPHGKGERDTDYQSVYMAMQGVGLDVFNPSPAKRINRRARVEMLNRLFGGSAEMPGTPRLVIAKASSPQKWWDTKAGRWSVIAAGNAVAPALVEACESLVKKAGDDDPEGSQRKDEDDKTHAPAACGYGLWLFEQEAFTENTVRIALAAAKGARV